MDGQDVDRSGHLSQVPLFRGLAAEALGRIVGLAHPTTMDAGAFFFTEGDAAEAFSC